MDDESEPEAGYGAWSARYDEPGNPIVAIEQPAVWSLLEPIAAGNALDVACGTGRHTRHLVDLGHQVTGIDSTPEMLSLARRKIPEATFVEADLRALPFDDERFDLVVCGLALAHVPELASGIGELARVLVPGGRLVVSVLHPFQAQLGWHAPFQDSDGRRSFVREHAHTHADYFSSLTEIGLRVRALAEPRLEADHVRAKRRACRHVPEATLAAYLDLPAVLVWEAEKPSH